MSKTSLSTLDSILKDFYLPTVVEMLNREMFLLKGLSWTRGNSGAWVPVPRGEWRWERPMSYALDDLQWESSLARVHVPVMEKLYSLLEAYFLPVLSMHQMTMRRTPNPIGNDGVKLLCQRCGKVSRFELPRLGERPNVFTEMPASPSPRVPVVSMPSREEVEKFLWELVDTHFRPWEKYECLPNGALKAMIAEWLTERLVEHRFLSQTDIKGLLDAEEREWEADFVVMVAEGMDLVAKPDLIVLPSNHPLAK